MVGDIEVEEAGTKARLHYRIECGPEGRTRTALIEGKVGGRSIRVVLEADGTGRWTLDGAPLSQLAGALAIDLRFTPATNTLSIRRLALAVGGGSAGCWTKGACVTAAPLLAGNSLSHVTDNRATEL